MKGLFYLIGVLLFIVGGAIIAAAPTVTQEIMGAIVILGGIMCVVGGAIVGAIQALMSKLDTLNETNEVRTAAHDAVLDG